MNLNSKVINSEWFFRSGHIVANNIDSILDSNKVTLPHNSVDVPINYFDEASLHNDFSYYYVVSCDSDDLNVEKIIKFDGVMCDSKVYVNGQFVTSHSDGYTPFEANLTPFLVEGNNVVTVLISGVENPNIPPFGGRIDFLCFPGIYRDVYLTDYCGNRIKNIKVETDNVLSSPKVNVSVFIEELRENIKSDQLTISLIGPDNMVIETLSCRVESDVETVSFHLENAELWSCEQPNLYTLRCEFFTDNHIDTYQTKFGIREAVFKKDGFYLNGRRLQLMGINRHQSYPYIGYAMGKRGQELDADLIKYDQGFNLVRTSHYPQSPHFLNRCDEIGLLVFEEIAGWQHVGNTEWQNKSLMNVRGMIERDWNHPSIILWGVRINESGDYTEFYQQTNQLARHLDSTRQTGGVRCIQDSEFLEDVYTMNDFVLGDGDKWVRSPQNVTGLSEEVPYLITEYAGHMYPTKRIDCESWQMEHVMRHLKVLDGSRANSNISGSIAWCLFDYNTHQDFGSGDKICYHGINDAFRLPKFAAYVYSSQQSAKDNVVLKPVTYWTRGERPEAKALPLVILTNCDYIEMSVPSGKRKCFFPDKNRFPHLSHPPVVIDEWNLGDFPIGDWGYAWADIYFTGYVDHQIVKEVTLTASPLPTELSINVQSTNLWANEGDATRISIEVLDQHGNVLPYFKDVLAISTTPNLSVIGPTLLTLEGGVACCWVKAGEVGDGHVVLESQVFGNRTIGIDVKQQEIKELEVQYG
ncbi:glycoside hydrolase family 2 protein [Vibrio scophthalmi]|uniref:glycoside hydrolase family 2 protein n=1 Tax=Vibrio scophthalmi TaxID=45658 RepID=UPI002FEFE134